MIRSWWTIIVTVGQECTTYYTECTKYLFYISIRIAWSNRNYVCGWKIVLQKTGADQVDPFQLWERELMKLHQKLNMFLLLFHCDSSANVTFFSRPLEFWSVLAGQLGSTCELSISPWQPFQTPPSPPALSTCSVNEVNVLAPWWVSAKVTCSDACCNPLASVLCTHTRAFSIIQRVPGRRRQRDDIHLS